MVSPLFIAQARVAIDALRTCNVSDATIACVISDVRAAAIAEERLRVEAITSKNPPSYPTWVQMMNAFKDEGATVTQDKRGTP
jgi:hypothetical protein